MRSGAFSLIRSKRVSWASANSVLESGRLFAVLQATTLSKMKVASMPSNQPRKIRPETVSAVKASLFPAFTEGLVPRSKTLMIWLVRDLVKPLWGLSMDYFNVFHFGDVVKVFIEFFS